MSTGSELINN